MMEVTEKYKSILAYDVSMILKEVITFYQWGMVHIWTQFFLLKNLLDFWFWEDEADVLFPFPLLSTT